MPTLTPAEIATTAMTAGAQVLHAAGCLVEPKIAEPEMTLRDAAELLCVLSRTPRLDDPGTDHTQLLTRSEMVEYAWGNAVRAGIDPADLPRANQARRLLLAHHGLR